MSRSPIVGATVSVEALGIRAGMRDDGSFGFYEVPVGWVSVRVEAPSHAVVVDDIEVTSEENISFVQFALPDLNAVLAEILVEGPRGKEYPTDLTAADLVARKLPGLRSCVPAWVTKHTIQG